MVGPGRSSWKAIQARQEEEMRDSPEYQTRQAMWEQAEAAAKTSREGRLSLSPEEERFLESIRADQVRECDASARDLIIPPILIERISALARQSRNGFAVVYGLRYRNTLRIFPYRSYLLTQITEIVRDVSRGAHTMTVMYFSNYFIHRLRGRINQLQEPVEVPSESLHG